MLLPSVSPSLARTGSLVLLAPAASTVPETFGGVEVNAAQHATMLAGMQRLRGQVYLRDGAITSAQLTADGCHVQAADEVSWHVLSLQPDGRVSAAWSNRLRAAIESDMSLARLRNLAYAEVGGWAVAEEWRRTTQAATTALSTYALAETLGGCIGITTATVRHCSSRILRKLGGRSLECAGTLLPSYFDPQYGCEMEILRFDSSAPGRKYDMHVARLARQLRDLPVICATPGLRMAAEETAQGLLPSLAALAERHVPCFGSGELVPA
jgi:hypothetical protein